MADISVIRLGIENTQEPRCTSYLTFHLSGSGRRRFEQKIQEAKEMAISK